MIPYHTDSVFLSPGTWCHHISEHYINLHLETCASKETSETDAMVLIVPEVVHCDARDPSVLPVKQYSRFYKNPVMARQLLQGEIRWILFYKNSLKKSYPHALLKRPDTPISNSATPVKNEPEVAKNLC